MTKIARIPTPHHELAEAILRGAEAMNYKQTASLFVSPDGCAVCVLGAAYVGYTGELPDCGLSRHVITVLYSAFPELRERDDSYLLPLIDTAPLSLYTLLAQLNDIYMVPLKALAKWLNGAGALILTEQPVIVSLI